MHAYLATHEVYESKGLLPASMLAGVTDPGSWCSEVLDSVDSLLIGPSFGHFNVDPGPQLDYQA